MRAARTISCRVWNLSSSSEAMVLSGVLMGWGQAKPLGGAGERIELDEHRGVAADDPRVVAGVEHEGARGGHVEDAAVRVGAAHPAAGEEAHVGVHAQLGLHDRLHVGRPAEAGRIAHALDAAVGGLRDVDGDAADLAVDRALDRREERIARGAGGRGAALRRGALGANDLSRALARHPDCLLGATWDLETLTPAPGLVKSGTLGRPCPRSSTHAVW